MMIKKIFLFLFLFSFEVSAQNIYQIAKESSLDSLLQMMKNPAQNEELLVKLAFSLEPKYHQYVMPMIGRMYGISEKTRMMPGIVEWRRKLPTRIAPQLSDYAKENLRYLNPAFYPFLMPEAWPPLPSEKEKATQKEPFLPRVYQVSSVQEMEKVFPSTMTTSLAAELLSGKQKVPLPKKDVFPLQEGDVKTVLSVMNKLKSLEVGLQGHRRRNALMEDYNDMNILLEAHVNPCRSLITRLNKIDADKWFEKQVLRENMDVETFIEKCDATIKAYRMSLARPGVSTSILNLAEEAQKLPKDSYQRQLNMTLIRMFHTSKDNVTFVKKHKDELRETFNKKILFLGTPLLLDF